MKKIEFDILCELVTHRKYLIEYSEDDIESGLVALQNKGFLNDRELTSLGMNAIERYRVKNAVIMAAGLSTRFIPFSYNKPKGLTVVKGEILIEREIRQLQEAGIDEIYVVVGYMKELFFYLEDKFDVKLIINSDYINRNNNGSLWLVGNYLDNTYICSSDNYFTENVFEPYVYQSYYAVEYKEGKTAERGVEIDEKGYISKTFPNAQDSWVLLGHVYWDREFSKKFISCLEKIYDEDAIRPLLWERIYDRFIDVLPPLYARKYKSVIYEFDTFQDLEGFDPYYYENVDSSIINNICKILQCDRSELWDFALMNAGLTNSSFSFMCRGEKFVYRHCFPFSRNIVDRKRESIIQTMITNSGIDKTCLYIDSRSGWKISRFVEHTNMVFNDEKQLKMVIEILRRIHNVTVSEEFRFDFRIEIIKVQRLLNEDSVLYTDFQSELRETIFKLLDYVETDNWPLSLTHNDINQDNFLVHGNIYELIDWEYSGLNDKAYDIAKLILKSEAIGKRAHTIICKYYGRECTYAEERHILACGAIEDYYWLIWGIYMEQNGRNIQRDIYRWYKHAKVYGEIAMQMYRNDK